MKSSIRSLAATCACAALLATDALAQQYVYPAKGQSADKQKKDESACQQWGMQQTGYDPTPRVYRHIRGQMSGQAKNHGASMEWRAI
jgi:hypothetical protein